MKRLNYFKNFTVIIMSIFYIQIGIKHFTDYKWFMNIMPPYLPYHKELVFLSGFFEIIFGLMILSNRLRFYASWGIILLLIAVFPDNIYLAQTNGAALDTTPLIAWGRLPFQLVFIVFAHWHTKP